MEPTFLLQEKAILNKTVPPLSLECKLDKSCRHPVNYKQDDVTLLESSSLGVGTI